MNSSDHKACEGCKHITNKTDEFCYMFFKKPNTLPCAQHDKYADLRRANGRKIHEGLMNGT